jgi:hypothetical protein
MLNTLFWVGIKFPEKYILLLASLVFIIVPLISTLPLISIPFVNKAGPSKVARDAKCPLKVPVAPVEPCNPFAPVAPVLPLPDPPVPLGPVGPAGPTGPAGPIPPPDEL